MSDTHTRQQQGYTNRYYEQPETTKSGNDLSTIYHVTPAPKEVSARFNGNEARCGKCNHKLGEFAKADGSILCTNVNRGTRCKTMNRLKK